VIIWNGKGGVQDRTIYEDSIFAKVTFVVFDLWRCSPLSSVLRCSAILAS
jgi:hypothetical protein